MRPICLLLLGIVCSDQVKASEGSKGMQCVERLRLPFYSFMIRGAGITGTAISRFRLTAAGEIRDLQVTGVQKIVEHFVKNALTASKFAPNCDQEIEIQFTFRLEGERSLDPQTYVVFHPPNRFEIVARPPEMIVD